MAKIKAKQQAGDDDEGDEAELSDAEDAGVQDGHEDDEAEEEDPAVWWRGRHHLEEGVWNRDGGIRLAERERLR